MKEGEPRKMSEEEEWKIKLEELGLGAELPSESEKAEDAGFSLVSLEEVDKESEDFTRKLMQEDPRNLFGGFPTSMEQVISLIETLKTEWIEQGVPPNLISVLIHSSCVNGKDCITLVQNGGNRYHYNTKKIINYSRGRVISFLKTHEISFSESDY